MSNGFSVKSLGEFKNIQRIDLKEALGFTSCEISINTMEANTNVPFVHHHKENEEVYIILDGNGEIKLDNELILIKTGDIIRVAPSVKRQIFAKTQLNYICIQAKENSLTQFTFSDGVVE
ncbi:cupin domain-containing protein [Campylobacter sp. RM12647]|uniref:cupin domain-containing protein n=1 Tax=Campylobacter sp. RM12647 TaxID=2735737 RepID=UPI001D395F53|nr:cupin domain-containing protein [Campylobacter sp. RM12647]